MIRRDYTEDWPKSYYPSFGPGGDIKVDAYGLGSITRSNMHIEERYGLPVPWRATWDVFDVCCCRVCCGCRPIEGEAAPWPEGMAPTISLQLETDIEMEWSSDGQPHSCDYSALQAFYEQEWIIERTSDIFPCEWRRFVEIPVLSMACCEGQPCGPFPLGGSMLMIARWEGCVGADPEWPHKNHCCNFELQIAAWNNADGPDPGYGSWPIVGLIHFMPVGIDDCEDCPTSDRPECFQMGLGMDCLQGNLSLLYSGYSPPYLVGWSCYEELIGGPEWYCVLKITGAAIEMIPPDPEV